MTKNCRVCGIAFEDRSSNKSARYCSRKCQRKAGDDKRRPRRKVCILCGKDFESFVRSKKRIHQFCSIRCAKIKGETRIASSGYRTIYLRPSKVKADFRGSDTWPYVYEHIAIAEKALGRRLKKGEMVHHVNGNTLVNRNNNLLICTRKYHNELNYRMARLYQQEHFTDA